MRCCWPGWHMKKPHNTVVKSFEKESKTQKTLEKPEQMRTNKKCSHLFKFCLFPIFEIWLFWKQMQQKRQKLLFLASKRARKRPEPIPIQGLQALEPNCPGYKRVLHGPKQWNMAYHGTIFSSFGQNWKSDPGRFLGQNNDKTVTRRKTEKIKK